MFAEFVIIIVGTVTETNFKFKILLQEDYFARIGKLHFE